MAVDLTTKLSQLVDLITPTIGTGITVTGTTTANGLIPTGATVVNGLNLVGANNPGLGASTTQVANWTTSLFTFSTAINYGGVTLSNSVTGTGSMVLAESPTFTGITQFEEGVQNTGGFYFQGYGGYGSANAVQGELNVTGGGTTFASANRGLGTYQPLSIIGSTVTITAASGITFTGATAFNSTLTLAGAMVLYGSLQIGSAYTSGVVAQTGYMNITDSGGTVRRVLVG